MNFLESTSLSTFLRSTANLRHYNAAVGGPPLGPLRYDSCDADIAYVFERVSNNDDDDASRAPTTDKPPPPPPGGAPNARRLQRLEAGSVTMWVRKWTNVAKGGEILLSWHERPNTGSASASASASSSSPSDGDSELGRVSKEDLTAGLGDGVGGGVMSLSLYHPEVRRCRLNTSG